MRILSITTLVLLALSFSGTSVIAETIYLDAAFNDKAIGEPIGTGGPIVNEPVVVSTTITAIVTDGPMGSPSLQISDNSDTGAGAARFEFLNDVEITTGTVVISADFWFNDQGAGSYFYFYVRERTGSNSKFASLVFEPDGVVYLGNGSGGLGAIGTWTTDKLYRVILDFNMDAGTFDVYLDGSLARDDQPHEVATGDGIGAILFGCREDADLDGSFNIDVVAVTDFVQSTSTETATWGRIKGGYRR